MKKLFLIISIIFSSIIAFGQSADDYYRKALDAADRRMHIYVEDFMDKAIKLDSTKAEYYLLRAKSNTIETTDTLKYIKGIKDYNKALNLGSKKDEVYKGIAAIQTEMATILSLASTNNSNDPNLRKRSQYYEALASENKRKADLAAKQ